MDLEVWNLTGQTTHHIATLASCPAPETVGGMRSFIGAYKVLARVLPNCSRFMAPLDDIVAGQQSNEVISWSNGLRAAFKLAQLALSSNRTITLPKPDDLLWIVTDGAVWTPGIGATLYVTHGDKLLLAGFFSGKLEDHKFPGCLVRSRHFRSQSTPNTSVLIVLKRIWWFWHINSNTI